MFCVTYPQHDQNTWWNIGFKSVLAKPTKTLAHCSDWFTTGSSPSNSNQWNIDIQRSPTPQYPDGLQVSGGVEYYQALSAVLCLLKGEKDKR